MRAQTVAPLRAHHTDAHANGGAVGARPSRIAAVTLQRCGGSPCPPAGCDLDRQTGGVPGPARPSAGALVTQTLAAPGEQLDEVTRADMEAHFGHDFGEVRIHRGPQADASARAVDALAYTAGRDIVFGPGQYAPGTAAGQRILAHELSHVVQQEQGPVDAGPVSGGLRVSDPVDRHERDAVKTAQSLPASRPAVDARYTGGPCAADAGPHPPVLQRQLGGPAAAATEELPVTQVPATPLATTGSPPGAGTARPKSADFWPCYAEVAQPLPRKEVWKLIGGFVGRKFQDGDSCAARVSWGLNGAGMKIPLLKTPPSFYNSPKETFNNKPGDGNNYIVGAPAMVTYLTGRWGTPVPLQNAADLAHMENSLAPGQCSVFAGKEHTGVIKKGYVDSVVADHLPVDAWALP
jgi:hypothetical protein